MDSHEAGAAVNYTTALQQAQCSLLLTAAGVLRLRYVQSVNNSDLSATDAHRLANTLESVALGDIVFDDFDRKEAIALAHRVIDNDHPEHSRMWPSAL